MNRRFDPVLALEGEDVPFRSLHDRIYAALRRALMAGKLPPGEAVSIRALAEEFGTSVIPVRDALKRLVVEGALSVLPNRTVVVSRMTRRRFQEILNVRLSVETMLARQAAERVRPDDVAELDRINEKMQAAVGADVQDYLLANQNFHFRLYSVAQSTVMLPIVESLWLQVGPFLNGVFTAAGTSRAKDAHADVLKALRRYDPVAVAAAISRDLADAADEVLARGGFVEDETKTAVTTEDRDARARN